MACPGRGYQAINWLTRVTVAPNTEIEITASQQMHMTASSPEVAA